MKWVTFTPPQPGAKPRAGLVRDVYVLDADGVLAIAQGSQSNISSNALPDPAEEPVTMLRLLQAGPAALRELEPAAQALLQGQSKLPSPDPRVYLLEQVRLAAPVPEPRTIRDFYAFEAHVRRARARRGLDMVPEWYEFPVFYFSNPGAIYGPKDEVPYPSFSSALDYELEVACVIGKAGMDISAEEAEAYIAGYLIMNDWSARDIQQKEMRVGLGPAKAKDFATSLGPYLVTPEELVERRVSPGRYDLEMLARVNGSLYSRGNFKDIYWSFCQMIAWASQDAWLYPGDVIGSGTVGTGCILELGPEERGWLRPGDRVELEVEGLGTLVNTVGPPRKGR